MGLLNRNFLEKGYYYEDSIGELTKIDTIQEIVSAQRKESLYYHDGYCMTRVQPSDYLDLSDVKD